MIQKFLVEIEDQRNTRWLVDSEELRHRLEILAYVIADTVTEGPKPRILVIQEEKPEPEEQIGRKDEYIGHAGAYSNRRD